MSDVKWADHRHGSVAQVDDVTLRIHGAVGDWHWTADIRGYTISGGHVSGEGTPLSAAKEHAEAAAAECTDGAREAAMLFAIGEQARWRAGGYTGGRR